LISPIQVVEGQRVLPSISQMMNTEIAEKAAGNLLETRYNGKRKRAKTALTCGGLLSKSVNAGP
jgi:hypothetical protein